MKIVFFGASSLGYKCCQAIINSGHNVAAIVTIPENFDIKYKKDESKTKVKNVLYSDFNSFNKLNNIPVIEINGNINEYTEKIISYQPDLIIVIGWYYNIPKSILNIPSKGTIGIHGSLLPKFRGNAPFVWAMIEGEKETGVSLFYFDDGIDTGNIIGQEVIEIKENDTIKNILEQAEVKSQALLLEYLPEIENNTAPSKPQNHNNATIYPKRSPNDGLINWDWDAKKIKNFINAQTRPYPGAFTFINGKKVIIWDADIEN